MAARQFGLDSGDLMRCDTFGASGHRPALPVRRHCERSEAI
jgi:hypothetical protein